VIYNATDIAIFMDSYIIIITNVN